MSIFRKRGPEEKVQALMGKLVRVVSREDDARVVAAAMSCVLGNFCWNAELPVDRAVDAVVGTYRERKRSEAKRVVSR